MSEIEELREEIAKLRAEITMLRAGISVHHYHHQQPLTPYYYVQPPFQPVFPGQTICLNSIAPTTYGQDN